MHLHVLQHQPLQARALLASTSFLQMSCLRASLLLVCHPVERMLSSTTACRTTECMLFSAAACRSLASMSKPLQAKLTQLHCSPP